MEVALTVVPWSTYASVVSCHTLTVAEPATPALPPPAPPTASVVTFSDVEALIDRPLLPDDTISAFWPMYASVTSVRTSVVFDTPTPADPPMDTLPAMRSKNCGSDADSDISPPTACTVALLLMNALVVVFMTSTAIDPEIPAEPPALASTASVVICSPPVALRVTGPEA